VELLFLAASIGEERKREERKECAGYLRPLLEGINAREVSGDGE
jgi:hypothetical protein